VFQTPTPTPAPAPTPAVGITQYKVAKGDTYSSIAAKFHVTVKALTDANPNVEATKLQIGQTIQIPAPAPTTTAPTLAAPTGDGTTIYEVKSGDTLSRIAGNYGVTVKAIRNLNNLTTDRITVGQKLKIPAKSAATK
jgi:LysM repeat protein